MAAPVKGLRLKPTYEDLIPIATSYGLQNVRFPNRGTSFFKTWIPFITT